MLSAEQIAVICHETLRAHEKQVTGKLVPPWDVLPVVTKAVCIAKVRYVLSKPKTDIGPQAVYDFCRPEGAPQFDNLSNHRQEQVFLFRGIVNSLSGWT